MDWKGFDKDIRKLADSIDWSPDVVVGVVRGGVIPAAMLAQLLKVRDMRIVKVRHVGESGRRVADDPVPDCADMKVLVVEDMLKTGRSLIAAKEHFEESGAEVKTACLYTMPRSEIVPDYSLKQVKEEVEFPWE